MNCLKFGLSWGKMAVTHFVMHVTHVLRVYKRKQKNCLGKTLLKIWLRFDKKSARLSTKLLLEKSAKTKQT